MEGRMAALEKVMYGLETLLTNASIQDSSLESDTRNKPVLDLLRHNMEVFKTKITEGHFQGIDSALSQRLSEFKDDVSSQPVEWQFVKITLRLLYSLSLLLRVESNPREDNCPDTSSTADGEEHQLHQGDPAMPASGLEAEANRCAEECSDTRPAADGEQKKLPAPMPAPALNAEANRCDEKCSDTSSAADGEKQTLPQADPAPALPPQHSVTAKKAVQLCAILGFCPSFLSGVGIPIHRRRDVGVFLLHSGDKLNAAASLGQRNARLSVCIGGFAQLMTVPELKAVIVRAHLNDVLAALLQLLYTSPQRNQKQPSSSSASPEADKNEDAAHDVVDIDLVHSPNREGLFASFVGDRRLYECVLERLLAVVGHDVIMRELMVLKMGGGPKQTQSSQPPAWMNTACNRLLVRLYKLDRGILHLYSAISTGSDLSLRSQMRHIDVVAMLVAGMPSPDRQADDYARIVSRQLLSLLNMNELGDLLEAKESAEAQLPLLAGRVANKMSSVLKYEGYMKTYFYKPLTEPLQQCAVEHFVTDGRVIVDAHTLSECVKNVHQVYVGGKVLQTSAVSVLQSVAIVLWNLYCVSRAAALSIQRKTKEVLTFYLRTLGGREAALYLRDLCIGTLTTSRGAPPGHGWSALGVRFVSQDQGVQAVSNSCGDGCQSIPTEPRDLNNSHRALAIVGLLKELNQEGVTGDVLVISLEELTDIISVETQPQEVMVSERTERSEGEVLGRRVALMNLLATLCEVFGAECLINCTLILRFVKASLQRGIVVIDRTSDDDMIAFESESMSMALGLLTAVMAGAIEVNEADRQMMDEVKPLLEVIGANHPDEFIREMAADIRVAIATRGAVWSSLQEGSRERKEQRERRIFAGNAGQKESKRRPASKPLIEVLPDPPAPALRETNLRTDPPAGQSHHLPTSRTASASSETPPENQPASGKENESVSKTAKRKENDPVSENTSTSNQPKELSQAEEEEPSPLISSVEESKDASKGSTQRETAMDTSGSSSSQPKKSSLQVVFQELCDPLLPVRGHALVALAQLIEKKDPETLGKKDVVQKVLQENIRHADSYLYLAAVQGMSALSRYFPESVVPALAKEFAGVSHLSAASLTPDHRLKVGEALMKATMNLGATAPKYRDQLLGAVLSGARDADAAVRASSLSNLATLCALLRFSLGPVMEEVLGCCAGLLKTDEAIVRRAAALTLYQILEGLDKDALHVLASALSDLYQLLKGVHYRDRDEAVRLHVNMALNKLSEVIMPILFPPQTLQKRIQVLSNQDTF